MSASISGEPSPSEAYRFLSVKGSAHTLVKLPLTSPKASVAEASVVQSVAPWVKNRFGAGVATRLGSRCCEHVKTLLDSEGFRLFIDSFHRDAGCDCMICVA